MIKTAFHFLLLVFLSSGSAFAWSSPASKTQYRLKTLALAIQAYQLDHGQLPSPATYREDLQNGYLDSRDLQDAWKQPFIYRVPGAHEEFDLYSIGPDGIDNRGARDDVTASGVNDGYHWKKTWPAGRRLLILSMGTGALCLLLGRWLRWSIVLPIAGVAAGVGSLEGCTLLLHPGITPRNDALGGVIFLLFLFLLACLLFLFRALRQPSASTDSLPTFLSEAQIRELLAPMEPSQKLQVIRYRSPARASKRHCQEMTAFALKDLILHSVMAKHLSGGNLAVHLPITGRTLIGNPDGLYWLDTNP